MERSSQDVAQES